MSTGSIGGTTSFWQQDQNYWSQQTGWSSQISASDSLLNAVGSAETTLSKGLSAIANGTALTRVNNQLIAGIKSVVGQSSAPTKAAPATAVGTTSVTLGTTLQTLGIPANASIYVSANGNTTVYASTGSDTVGDLVNAVNVDLPTNAQVTASLNNKGRLVFTSRNLTDSVEVSGVYASNIGFAVGNQTFKPTKASAGTATPPASSSSSTSSKTTTTSSKSTTAGLPTTYSLNASSAASLLADSGASGSLVNLIA
jgi:hypothetical protein